MELLKGKTALVTGGSRGIGEAIVRSFARQGASVAFTYLSSSAKADSILNDLSGHAQVRAYRSDAADMGQAEALMKQVNEEMGGVDILVNNAGVTRDNLLLRMNEGEWDEVIHTNLKSVFNMTKLAIRDMMRSRKGSIINLSSVVGITGNSGQSNYAASKAGIIGFSKSIAREMGGRNIRCNVIAPGFIDTDMTRDLGEEVVKNYLAGIPLKRFGATEEVAEVAVFLASDMSSYVSGQVISVCGALNT